MDSGGVASPTSILLVDDRRENLIALRAILECPRYRLLTAQSGEEALAVAGREDVDLILLDVMMPAMGGLEVAERLKASQRSRRIPILFLTAFETDAQTIYRAYEVGAVDYLIKPLDPQIVLKKVEVFVDLVEQRREIERQGERLREAERREYESRLADLRMASDRRYRKLVDGIDHAIGWSADPQTLQLSFVSRQAPEILGFPPDAFLAPSFWIERIHPDDRDAVMEVFRLAVARQVDEVCNHRMCRADGTILWFHTGVSAERGIDGTPELHGISVDVTELKRAVEVRDELLIIVSHELRNPLASIVASAEAILAGTGSIEQARKAASAVVRGGERMERLIADLQDLAQLRVDGLKLEQECVLVAELVRDAHDLFRPIAAEKGLRLESSAMGEAPLWCDRQRAHQILVNLVGNAVKFTPHGGEIAIRARAEADIAVIAVSDTGPGIPRDELPHVFDRFWQGKRRNALGVGLGLAIAKRLVEAHGGRLWVESQPTRGTTFHFTLPLVDAPPSPGTDDGAKA